MRGMDGGWLDENEYGVDENYVDDLKPQKEESITTMNSSFVPISMVQKMVDDQVNERLKHLQGKQIHVLDEEDYDEKLLMLEETPISQESRVDIENLRESVKSFELMRDSI